MNYRTGFQNRIFHGLIGKLGFDAEQKEELVYSYTLGRTVESKMMYYIEMQQLINALTSRVKSVDNKVKVTVDACDKMRKKILSLCYEMQWTIFDTSKKRTVVDYVRLNEFLLKSGTVKKLLNELDYDELQQVVSQFELMNLKRIQAR
jgi:methyl coenzyme M reductase subunit D